jgi:hypothetical protein
LAHSLLRSPTGGAEHGLNEPAKCPVVVGLKGPNCELFGGRCYYRVHMGQAPTDQNGVLKGIGILGLYTVGIGEHGLFATA